MAGRNQEAGEAQGGWEVRYAGYPENQDSNIEWIGSIPAHWSVHRLKWTVLDCTNGVWGEEADGIDDIVCLRVADFDRDKFTITPDNLTIRAVEPKQLESRKLKKGDLLIEKSGGGEKQLVGCVVYFDHDFDAVSSNFVARMTVDPALSARYICYLHAGLYAGKLNYPAIKQTTGIQNLDTNEYLNTLVAYPPTVEQEQIAAFLDWKTGQIDALIAKKKELLEKLKEKRLAVITQAITKGLNPAAPLRDSGISWLGQVPEHWKIPTLKMRYAVELGKMLDEKRITGDCLVPYLRNVDVQWGKINFDELPEMDITEYEFLRYTIRENDVLVCEGGEVGRAAVVGAQAGVVGFQKALHRLRSETNEEMPRFIFYTLLWAVNTGVFAVEGASTIAHLTADQLRRYQFPQPPLSEQESIVSYLDEKVGHVSQMSEKINDAIARLAEYRIALITAATTGKIDVRNIKFGSSA